MSRFFTTYDRFSDAWIVWDRETSETAYKGDGSKAIYTEPYAVAKKLATARATNMSQFGPDFKYDGKWTYGQRGRAPKEVEEFLNGGTAIVYQTTDEAEIQRRIDEAVRQALAKQNAPQDYQKRTHYRFKTLMSVLNAGCVPLLVGPAGTGKTTASEQAAHVLGLPFYAIAVGSQSSKSDLLGFKTATGEYTSTAFRQAYEEGGVFLCDELDAGNANVLIVLNSALAGSFCAFPDKMVRKHEKFVFIGTANTYGTGANRQYVGRNQLDAATLDRFVAVDWPVDLDLEASMVEHLILGKEWHQAVLAARRLVESRGYRVVVSPRATIKGANLLSQGLNVNEVIEMTLLATASQDQREAIRQAALDGFQNV